MNIIFDIETDGIDYTKIHCASFRFKKEGNWTTFSTHDYEVMKKLFSKQDVVYIGHYITFFDIPAVEKILGIEFPKNRIDTLYLSQYLFDNEELHGLEDWGERVGTKKKEIAEEDWKILSDKERKRFDKDPYVRSKYYRIVEEVMIPRCESDVDINTQIFELFMEKLNTLYSGNYDHFVKYLSFLVSNIDLQVRNKWKVDVERLEKNLGNLMKEFVSSKETLENEMPKVEKLKTKNKPKQIYKKDGCLTKYAENWFNELDKLGLSHDTEGPIKIFDKYEEPNANSVNQVKDWLYSFDWKPDYFKFRKNVEGETNMIPQIKKNGELSDSVKLLIEKNPKIAVLENYTIIKSRKEDLQGFQRDMSKEGFLKAEIGGVTSTLRVRHRTIVNLPGVDKLYGKEIREVLISKKDHILCGSDLDSLEDRCKQHWIKPYDPEYVESMSDPFYDPHLDLAIIAGDISKEEVDFFKYKKNKDFSGDRIDEFFLNLSKENQEKLFNNIVNLRKGYKTTNYSATYGVGYKTLSRTSGKTEREAKKMLEVFHRRNWAMSEVEKNAEVREIGGQKWVLNEVNNIWYPLRSEKDIFSALNQGLGAYIFNLWIYFQRKQGLEDHVGQFHDEVILDILNTNHKKSEVKEILHSSIRKVNKALSLNVDMSCDVQFGHKYSEIH